MVSASPNPGPSLPGVCAAGLPANGVGELVPGELSGGVSAVVTAVSWLSVAVVSGVDSGVWVGSPVSVAVGVVVSRLGVKPRDARPAPPIDGLGIQPVDGPAGGAHDPGTLVGPHDPRTGELERGQRPVEASEPVMVSEMHRAIDHTAGKIFKVVQRIVIL